MNKLINHFNMKLDNKLRDSSNSKTSFHRFLINDLGENHRLLKVRKTNNINYETEISNYNPESVFGSCYSGYDSFKNQSVPSITLPFNKIEVSLQSDNELSNETFHFCHTNMKKTDNIEEEHSGQKSVVTTLKSSKQWCSQGVSSEHYNNKTEK